jgi:hypothetical protein
MPLDATDLEIQLSRDATTGANKLAHGRWGLSHKQIMVAFGVSAIKSSRFTEALSAMSLEYPSLDFAEAVNLVKQAAVERAGSSDACEPKDVKKATTMASSAHKLSANATLELIPACEVDSTLWKGDNDNQYQARNNHNHSGVSPSTSGIPKQAMRASLISSLSTPASTSVSVPGGTDDSSLSYDTSSSSSFTDPANKSRNCTADPHVQPELTMEKKALSTPLPQAQQSATAPLTPISNGPKRPMRDEGEGQPPHKLPRLEADLTTPEYISSSPPSVCPERVSQSLQSWLQPGRRLNDDVLFAVLDCFVVKPFTARHITAPENGDWAAWAETHNLKVPIHADRLLAVIFEPVEKHWILLHVDFGARISSLYDSLPSRRTHHETIPMSKAIVAATGVVWTEDWKVFCPQEVSVDGCFFLCSVHQADPIYIANNAKQRHRLWRIRSDQCIGSRSWPSCQTSLRGVVVARHLLDSPVANARVHRPKNNLASSTRLCDKCQPSSSSSSHLHFATSEAPSQPRGLHHQALGLPKPSSLSTSA